MSYYEKLGWKLGKENEIFLKKGPEKLFFETLEKLNPKYVEVFKELLKYINKNSIVVFIPHFFPDGQNKEIQTYDELIRDGKRLLEEGEEQRNCVFSYFKNITEGKCLIYSLLTEVEENSEDILDGSVKEKKRYTIEIIEKNSKFEVVQFLGKFNKKYAETVKLETELREKLKKIRTINIPKAAL